MDKCIICGKEVIRKRKRDTGKYCSHDCYLRRSGLPLYVIKTCAYCKKEFKARSKFKNKKCCSLKCTSLYGWSLEGHRNATTTPCVICGKPVRAIASRRKNGRGKYCGKICYTKGEAITHKGMKASAKTKEKIRLSKIGKLNPAYIHGHHSSHLRYLAGYTNKLKRQIKERDNNVCQSCGVKERLQIHHLDHDPLNNNPNNLITWCIFCHMRHHKTRPDKMWGDMLN